LQSEDCTRLEGPERDPQALVIASMFATSGADSAVELSRQRAVQLAVEEINDRGGIPARDSADARKLLLVGCDAGANRDRAAEHLASLGVRAVLGLSDSDQLAHLLGSQLLAANVLTLSTALASDGINSVLDADLAWLLALTVEQRAPVLEAVLSALEQHLQDERSEPLKLALLVRYDTVGRAAVSALRSHELGGVSIGMPERNPERLRVDRYPDTAADQQALIAAYRGFAPDIVLMIGGVDVLSGFIAPLERSYESEAAARRPHYVLTEETKGPALLALARELPSLLERVHGVGAAVSERSRRASEGFLRRYAARFKDDELASAPRVAAAYDALYALAYAIAAVEPGHELGGRLAQALHALEAPEQAADATFEVGPDALGMGFSRSSSGEPLALLGASGELHWDSYGSLRTGALEAWCLDAASGSPRYGNAPWLFDVAADSFSARAGSCDRWLMSVLDGEMPAATNADHAMTGRAMSSAPMVESASTSGAAGSASAAMASAGAAAPMMQGTAGAGADMPRRAETPQSSENQSGKALPCGQQACQRDKEQCCVAMLGPLMVDLSCKSRSAPTPLGAAGSGASMSCMFSAQCASDADCEKGSECCADAQQARCVPAGKCLAQSARRLACKSARECPAGQQCCLYGDSNTMSFSSSACAASCGIADTSVRLCLDDAGCADDPASTSCNPSLLWPLVSACWPKPPL
jgi:hypothetical protein